MTSKIIPVSDLRRKVSQTIKELQHSAHDEAVYITQHGRPQAVLVSYEHYEQLREQARHRMLPADIEVIRNDPELIALVERIKATPPNPAVVHPATASLSELLQNAPDDPDFDLESWTQQWQAIESQMKAIDRADDIAEGRG
ncbi:MAG TPA: type II toxin-antitoxin system Phd/YefM family antitoxin [Anaerolineae bacterium]|mgnify:CR=1 FL=1|nr:type II toxin-antitoxin system Phd/YefM family antitoxin [Anaerolineae bacterium]MCB0180006.1 type II toxin-antitoxin system Phd/YefM family antitoxin [Anaerolineae bacterium]MCB0226525.1 type II toxin-antitoxin system Phd/YefM family antitoxin [Anaerolineae bacterium]MCB9103316.1 type II toxin-antitoxin system Phd/YefM family antitoxin [Anaerolineales bacterium]HRV95163.1 type II toxin-antitoxin system Phd/YefM family antitoxin [Anaerolineae bacterium]